MNPINSFSGKYRFLSNFYPSPIKMGDLVYDTVEHAYQAAKCVEPLDRLMIRDATTPGIAKQLGRRVAIRDDWEEVKVQVMHKLLQMKFKSEYLKDMLLDTGDVELIEGNTWGDTFWGVCNGVGENHLGKLLMQVRSLLSPNDDSTIEEITRLKRALKYESDLCEQLLQDRKLDQDVFMQLRVIINTLPHDSDCNFLISNGCKCGLSQARKLIDSRLATK